MCTFYELKSPKWKQPLNILENVFYKQVLEFNCPFKFLCQTSGRQNHWSLVHMYAFVSYRRLSPQFQFSLSAVTLGTVVSYLGCAMLAAVRVEVRSRGHAPVRVVTKLNQENNASLVDPDPH